MKQLGPTFVRRLSGTENVRRQVMNDSVRVDPFVCAQLGVKPGMLAHYGYGRSFISEFGMQEGLRRYVVKDLSYDGKLLSRAIGRAFKAFRTRSKIRRIPLESVPFKGQTSAGFGYVGKKAVNYETALSRARGCLKAGRCDTPCIAYARGHFSTKDAPKTRLVWGFPFEMTLIEGMYAQPLISTYTESQVSPMAIGAGTIEIAASLNTALSRGHVYALDYSKFDSSIQPRLIHAAFDVLKSNFESVDEGEWSLIKQYFIYTKIAMPDGGLWQKRVGVPSGSYFTQLVDSVVNYIVLQYALLKLGVNPHFVKVLGDDSVFSVPQILSVRLLTKYIAELGITVNESKSQYDTVNPHFLGHSLEWGVLRRPRWENLERLVFPERAVTSPAVSVQRALGHYIDSGGDSMFLQIAFGINRSLDSPVDIFHVTRKFLPGFLLETSPSALPVLRTTGVRVLDH